MYHFAFMKPVLHWTFYSETENRRNNFVSL